MPFQNAIIAAFSCLLLASPEAQAAIPKNEAFFDIPTDHYSYAAVENLREKGLLSGYADGTFRPDKTVNRAEALAMISAQWLSEADKKKYTTSSFSDVASGVWFLPFVEWGRALNIIQGPPTATAFNGTRPVTKTEFIKMFLVSQKVDPDSFGDITLSLSRDAANTKAWYFPYLRYAVASSMTVATKQTLLAPEKPLTRGEVALLMHRFFLYRDGERSKDLLSGARTEVENVINFLSASNLREAQYASARAILMARGANEVRKDEPVVKVAVKISEGTRALVRAYEAAQKNDWKTVVKHSQDAWFLGDQAKKISGDATTIANQLQKYSKSFADQARANMK